MATDEGRQPPGIEFLEAGLDCAAGAGLVSVLTVIDGAVGHWTRTRCLPGARSVDAVSNGVNLFFRNEEFWGVKVR